MSKHKKIVLSVWVEDKAGVLSSVATAVRRRRLQHREPDGGRHRDSGRLPHYDCG